MWVLFSWILCKNSSSSASSSNMSQKAHATALVAPQVPKPQCGHKELPRILFKSHLASTLAKITNRRVQQTYGRSHSAPAVSSRAKKEINNSRDLHAPFPCKLYLCRPRVQHVFAGAH